MDIAEGVLFYRIIRKFLQPNLADYNLFCSNSVLSFPYECYK